MRDALLARLLEQRKQPVSVASAVSVSSEDDMFQGPSSSSGRAPDAAASRDDLRDRAMRRRSIMTGANQASEGQQKAVPPQSYTHPKHRARKVSSASRISSSPPTPSTPELPTVDDSMMNEDSAPCARSLFQAALDQHVENKENADDNVPDYSKSLTERLQAKRGRSAGLSAFSSRNQVDLEVEALGHEELREIEETTRRRKTHEKEKEDPRKQQDQRDKTEAMRKRKAHEKEMEDLRRQQEQRQKEEASRQRKAHEKEMQDRRKQQDQREKAEATAKRKAQEKVTEALRRKKEQQETEDARRKQETQEKELEDLRRQVEEEKRARQQEAEEKRRILEENAKLKEMKKRELQEAKKREADKIKERVAEDMRRKAAEREQQRIAAAEAEERKRLEAERIAEECKKKLAAEQEARKREAKLREQAEEQLQRRQEAEQESADKAAADRKRSQKRKSVSCLGRDPKDKDQERMPEESKSRLAHEQEVVERNNLSRRTPCLTGRVMLLDDGKVMTCPDDIGPDLAMDNAVQECCDPPLHRNKRKSLGLQECAPKDKERADAAKKRAAKDTLDMGKTSLGDFFKKLDSPESKVSEKASAELKALPLKERLLKMKSTSPDSADLPSVSPSTAMPSMGSLSTSKSSSTHPPARRVSLPSSAPRALGPPAVQKVDMAEIRAAAASASVGRAAAQRAATAKSKCASAKHKSQAQAQAKQHARAVHSTTSPATVSCRKIIPALSANSKKAPMRLSKQPPANQAPKVAQGPGGGGLKRPAPTEAPQKVPKAADPDEVPSLGSLLESSIPGWQNKRLRTGKAGALRPGFAMGRRRLNVQARPAQNAPPRAQSAPPPPPPPKAPEEPMPPPPPNMNERESAAYNEVVRILQVRKESFKCPQAWGFAVLNVQQMNLTAAQQSYRKLMQKLHPDKVGHLPMIEKAVEVTREAKEICERALSRQVPPGAPRELKSTTVCATKGRRRFRLSWAAPLEKETAPVQRYLINAFDPAYGKALTITVLEPDYSEELRRYVRLEELTSFVLSEQDLEKMPSLFQQRVATLQVAAGNDSGTGPWASVQVRMR